MKPSYVLRVATPEDAVALSEIASRTFKATYVNHHPQDIVDYTTQAYSIDQMRTELEDPNLTTLLAFPPDDASQPCGFLTLNAGSIRPQDTGRSPDDYIEVKRIYVDKPVQGIGVGGRLMQRALEIAAAKKISIVWLGAWQGNHGAHRFYEKQGFQVTGTRTFRVGAELHDDFIYTFKPEAPSE